MTTSPASGLANAPLTMRPLPLLLALSAVSIAEPPPLPGGGRWEQTLFDDFDGGLNASLWTKGCAPPLHTCRVSGGATRWLPPLDRRWLVEGQVSWRFGSAPPADPPLVPLADA